MKRRDAMSTAVLITAGLAGQSAISGSLGPDTLLMADEPPAEADLIVFAPDPAEATELLTPLIDAEIHYTYWGGEGEDMVRVPGTQLREVRSPQGRTFMVQVNPDTREVYSPKGDKIDPPRWLIESLRRSQ